MPTRYYERLPAGPATGKRHISVASSPLSTRIFISGLSLTLMVRLFLSICLPRRRYPPQIVRSSNVYPTYSPTTQSPPSLNHLLISCSTRPSQNYQLSQNTSLSRAGQMQSHSLPPLKLLPCRLSLVMPRRYLAGIRLSAFARCHRVQPLSPMARRTRARVQRPRLVCPSFFGMDV